jgi:cAMP phosphodiesterase
MEERERERENYYKLQKISQQKNNENLKMRKKINFEMQRQIEMSKYFITHFNLKHLSGKVYKALYFFFKLSNAFRLVFPQ